LIVAGVFTGTPRHRNRYAQTPKHEVIKGVAEGRVKRLGVFFSAGLRSLERGLLRDSSRPIIDCYKPVIEQVKGACTREYENYDPTDRTGFGPAGSSGNTVFEIGEGA